MITRIPMFCCHFLTASTLLATFICSDAGSSKMNLCDSHMDATRNVIIGKVAETNNKSITCFCRIYSNGTINAKINMSLAQTTGKCSERLRIRYNMTGYSHAICYQRCSDPEKDTSALNHVLPMSRDFVTYVMYTWTHDANAEASGSINIELQSSEMINVTCYGPEDLNNIKVTCPEAENLSNLNDVRLLITFVTVPLLLALFISFIICVLSKRISERNIEDESATGSYVGYEGIDQLKNKQKHKKIPQNPGKQNGQKNEEERPEVVYSLPQKSAKKKKENEEETSLQEKADDNEYTSLPVPVKSWERSEEVVDKTVHGDANKDEI